MLNLNENCEARYIQQDHQGTLSVSETWLGSYVHVVTGEVTVPGGTTLTIRPGAVVKFETGQGITVQPGGRLIADGTVAQRIVFTSIKDDSAGGDSNQDGTATAPAAGDWRGLLVAGGEVELDHAQLSYAGKPSGGSWDSTSGAIANSGGGNVAVSNSAIHDSFYDAIINWGSGTISAESTVISDCDRGLDPDGSTVTRLINCTMDGNRIGVWGHNGSVEMVNTIIGNSLEYGVYNILNSPITLNHCDVWSATGSNFANITDPTGNDGNISVDPGTNTPSRAITA